MDDGGSIMKHLFRILLLAAISLSSCQTALVKESSATLLLETFDSAQNLQLSWDVFGGQFGFGQDGGHSYAVMGQNAAHAAEVGSRYWSDYQTHIRFRLPAAGEFALMVRTGDVDPNNYEIAIAAGDYPNFTVTVSLHGQTGDLDITDNPGPFTGADQWRDLMVDVAGTRISVSLDSQTAVNDKDVGANISTQGDVRLVWVSGSDVQLDELAVTGEPVADAWTRLGGPPSGKVQGIWPNPNQPGSMALQLNHSGVWITRDGGAAWELALRGISTVDISNLARSPSDPNFLIALNFDGKQYYSHDDGYNWRNMAYIGGISGAPNAIAPIAFSPVSADRFYLGLGGQGCVAHSEDKGMTVRSVSSATYTCKDLIISALLATAGPAGQWDETLWLSSSKDGLGRSTDGGANWTFTKTAIPGQVLQLIAYAYGGGERIMASTANGVYYADNGNAASVSQVTWTKTNLPGAEHLARSASGTIYAALGIGLAVSSDEGQSFEPFEITFAAPGVIDAVAPDPSQPGTVLLGTHDDLLRLDPASQQLTSLGNGIGAGGVVGLVADPQIPSLVYAGTWSGWLWRSLDSGQHWGRMFQRDQTCQVGSCQADELSGQALWMLAIDQTNGCNLLAARQPGIIVSHDRGKTWKQVGKTQGLTSANIMDIKVHPKDARFIYAAAGCGAYFEHSATCNTDPQGVYRSSDGGDTFIRMGAPSAQHQVTALALDPTNVDRLWVGTPDAGVWRSEDGGATFVRMGESTLDLQFIQDVAVAPDRPQVLLAGGNSFNYHGWNHTTGDPQNEPNLPKVPSGVFRSTDGGETWARVGLPKTLDIEHIRFHPTVSGTIYIPTHGPGVFRSTDDGNTWFQMGEGMLYLDQVRGAHNYVFDLAFNADSSMIYAGSCGRGAFRLGGAAAPPAKLPACSNTSPGSVYLPIIRR
jgi:photosystem II stability/assembly factor-like uncharacterized protein